MDQPTHDAPPTNLRRSGRIVWLVPLGLAAAALGAAAWFFLRPAPAAEAPAAGAAPVAGAAPAPAPEAAAAEAPARADEAAGLLERASSSELLRRVLAAGDVVQRWVVVTANVAAGETPRRALPFLAPQGAFAVERRGAGLAISAASYARYDAFADAVASVDAAAAASAYRRLHGVLEAAHRTLGLAPGSLDALTLRALRRIADAPAPAEPVAVQRSEGVYVYADPRLEELTEVEKHLLRMGPRNERLIQAKARELLARIAPATAPAAAAPAPAPAPTTPTTAAPVPSTTR
jgi:PAS domain-containing protein